MRLLVRDNQKKRGSEAKRRKRKIKNIKNIKNTDIDPNQNKAKMSKPNI